MARDGRGPRSAGHTSGHENNPVIHLSLMNLPVGTVEELVEKSNVSRKPVWDVLDPSAPPQVDVPSLTKCGIWGGIDTIQEGKLHLEKTRTLNKQSVNVWLRPGVGFRLLGRDWVFLGFRDQFERARESSTSVSSVQDLHV